MKTLFAVEQLRIVDLSTLEPGAFFRRIGRSGESADEVVVQAKPEIGSESLVVALPLTGDHAFELTANDLDVPVVPLSMPRPIRIQCREAFRFSTHEYPNGRLLIADDGPVVVVTLPSVGRRGVSISNWTMRKLNFPRSAFVDDWRLVTGTEADEIELANRQP